MTHAISAVLTRDEIIEGAARRLGVRVVPLETGLTIIPLCDEWVDEWAARESVYGAAANQPRLNFTVVHHLMKSLAPGAVYALIETDYFGGTGDQAAAVYCGGRTLMEPRRAAIGPINQALQHLGVRAGPFLDEFDTVGLGRFRTLEDLLPGGAADAST